MDGKPDSGKTIYVPPTRIVECMSTDVLAVSNAMVAQALQFIRENFDKQIQVVEILKQVAVSRTGLEKGFRENFPRAPMEELRRLRLDLAKQLLRTTDDSIVQIARQSGFQTSHNLCRTFKREMNATPKSYRKSSTN
ncbi:helix-turn-helix domain-containing protein [Stieleria marina]|uniref:Xylose operon regulatory protein n=1 Tax=Stieleria marina TaxID=1930275 RepID=A0A517NRV6_9BACT|nr:Xylose operon regulatory protein [Planctomycetes bacterium K23_9]